MQFIYEEGGDIKAAFAVGTGSVQHETWQAETISGKRIKLRTKDIWLSFASPSAELVMQGANTIKEDIDISLLWECAPEEDFKFDVIAGEYFGDKVSTEQLVALAMALQAAPIYFRRRGRGCFQRAPEEQLKAAIASVERKRIELESQVQWQAQLEQGELPLEFVGNISQLLWNPDKNGNLYKALANASHTRGISPQALLLEVGAIPSALEIHQGKFLKEHFPRGVGFRAHPPILSSTWDDLALSNIEAVSIDDATTTEIDDAFSVTALPNQLYQIGVHIAAPGLGIKPSDEVDQIASERMSTVYYPGGKITMLPESVVSVFSLNEGEIKPALSLYVVVNEAGEVQMGEGLSPRTVIEKIKIKKNLRLHEVEPLVTQEKLESPEPIEGLDWQKELAILWSGAKCLFEKRQELRVSFGQRKEHLGPPDSSNLPRDFNFEIVDQTNQRITPDIFLKSPVDDRSWLVNITTRQRGSVIDTIVAEWMIFCNKTWGQLLANHELPGIFRVQQGWGALRTRMQTMSGLHEGLGVENYAWCTSPLRRYADLLNQWQLISFIQQGVMAKLVAPFPAKDTRLMSLCASFDTTYSAYNEYQNIVEKYWCLRWLSQFQNNEQQKLPWRGLVRVIKEGQVRVELVPLRLYVAELASQARGKQVEVDILSIDLLTLTAEVRIHKVIDAIGSADEVEIFEEDQLESDQNNPALDLSKNIEEMSSELSNDEILKELDPIATIATKEINETEKVSPPTLSQS